MHYLTATTKTASQMHADLVTADNAVEQVSWASSKMRISELPEPICRPGIMSS